MLLAIDIGNSNIAFGLQHHEWVHHWRLNPVHAIQSGIVLGYIGRVEYLVENIKKSLKGDTKVIATGGLSEVIAPLTNKFTTIEPWLTLGGLRLIAEKNMK